MATEIIPPFVRGNTGYEGIRLQEWAEAKGWAKTRANQRTPHQTLAGTDEEIVIQEGRTAIARIYAKLIRQSLLCVIQLRESC